MFRGQFLHSIDSKGRISLPARFRDVITVDNNQIVVITPAPFEPCLHAYPLPEWERLESRISEYSNLDPNIVRFKRLYISAAVECELDKNARIVVPQSLREKVGLDKDVFIAGMGRNFELWNKAKWDVALTIPEEQDETFKQVVMEKIRI
jgi:MraZ protein